MWVTRVCIYIVTSHIVSSSVISINMTRLSPILARLTQKQHLYYWKLNSPWSVSLSQGYFRKAKILQEIGHVDESLQVFLQCLALDENFHQTKQEVELVRWISLFLCIVGVIIKLGLQYVTNQYFSIDTKIIFVGRNIYIFKWLIK